MLKKLQLQIGMDQTEKIVLQSNQISSQNNPESQKGLKKLFNNEASFFAGQNQAQKLFSQNSSQNMSRAMSQTASQMDQQIMRGLSKKQKRRYTTFLEVLGIDVKGQLLNKTEQPIQDGQNIDRQQIEPKSLLQDIKQPGHPHEEVIPFRESENQVEGNLNGGNYSFSQNESKMKDKSIDFSQTSEHGHKFENLENRMLALDDQPDVVLQPVVSSESAFVDFQIQKTQENKGHLPVPKSTYNPNEEIEIDERIKYSQANLQVDKYHHQEGEMSIDNNFDPYSNNKPFSEFSYDMINSIYTPVSLQKAPIEVPSSISLDNYLNVQLGQHQLATVVEELKQIISEQKDIQIDEPFRLDEVYQQGNFQINPHFQSEQMNFEKDVEIDGPFEKPYIIQNKDIEIDGPSPRPFFLQKYQNQDINIDGLSEIYKVSPQKNQTIRNQVQNKLALFQQSNQEKIKNLNFFAKSDKDQRSSLHIVQEVQNKEKMDVSVQNAINNSEVIQNSFNIFNPSAKVFKTQSQNNQKPNSGFPKPKKSSQTSSFPNQDHIKTGEVHPNRRKFSQSSRSAGLNSVNNKVSSNKRANEYAQGSNGSFSLGQNIYDSRELNSLQDTNERIIEIEQQIEPHDSVKITQNNNSFSNRSENSSIKSKRSNRFSDEIFNEKQIPPFDSLQLVKDGMEPRLERKSRSSQNSNRSHHSRSASTCKKSYDDLSEIHMEKIDQKGQQLEQKSIKRSLHRIYTPVFSVDEVQGQKHEVENELTEINQRKTQEDIEIDGKPEEINWSKHYEEKRNENYSIETSYNRFQQEKIFSQRKDNLIQTVSHQITIHLDIQEEEELIYESRSVQYQCISSASSKKTTESDKKKQKNEYLESQRNRKMDNLRFDQVFQIHIQNPLPIEQRLDNVLIFCKDYQAGSHHSNYEKSKLKEILRKNFQIFGTELQPITDLGLRMLHDGIFACTFIRFVKQNKNSGMLESLMFSQFEQQVGIRTNKDIFFKQLKRVKEEREMHYNNEFQIRLQQHEQRKAKEEARKIQMSKNVISQAVLVEPKPKQSKVMIDKKEKEEEIKEKIVSASNLAISKVWQSQLIIDQSYSSLAPSSETMTIDEQGNFQRHRPIKKARIQDISPRPSIPQIKENGSMLDSFGPESVDQSQTFQVKEKSKSEIKKPDLPKKRITKKKEKKILDFSPVIVVKSEYTEDENFDETISQVQQKPYSQRKQEKPVSEQIKDPQVLGQKQKVTKGILKGPRASRNSQQPKKIKTNRSPSKKDIQKVSKKKKEEVSKDKEREQSKSKPGKSQKKRRNSSPDNQQKNLQVTISPRNKISFQKAVEEKVNQVKVVKFSQSTKGGESISHQKRRNQKIFDILPQEEPQQETQAEEQPVKRTLRSRSKK